MSSSVGHFDVSAKEFVPPLIMHQNFGFDFGRLINQIDFLFSDSNLWSNETFSSYVYYYGYIPFQLICQIPSILQITCNPSLVRYQKSPNFVLFFF